MGVHTFAIVSFNQSLQESVGLSSLLASIDHLPSKFLNEFQLEIVVFDNSSNRDNKNYLMSNISRHVLVQYLSCGANIGISKAYNQIRSACTGNYITFLDQDSLLPNNFCTELFHCISTYHNSVGLFVPKVVSKFGHSISPSVFRFGKNFAFNGQLTKIFNLKNYSFINSGLTISKDLFDRCGGYCEDIFLDWADHEFIARLKKIELRAVILDSVVLQNLSSISDSFNSSISRYRIFLTDLRAIRRVHNSKFAFLMTDVSNLVRLCIKHRSFKFLKIRVTA